MPNKHNDSRRHKFDKATYKVNNWAEYTESLRRRGDITVWFTEEAIAAWKPAAVAGRRGRPPEYSDVAIESCLMIRQVFKLPLRQTEGFLRSLIALMGLNIKAPDYTSLSKRSLSIQLSCLANTVKPGSYIIIDSTGIKVYGKDEWHQEKHKVKPKRTWRKLHLAINEHHQIVAHDLTDNSVGDTSAVDSLLEQAGDFDCLLGDGAYDGDPVYAKVLAVNPQATVVIPPPKNAVEGNSQHQQRNAHTEFINKHGRMAWQKQTSYGLRALVELAMLRYKTIIGPKLKARKISQQKIEAAVSVRVLNKMTRLGMPITTKVA